MPDFSILLPHIHTALDIRTLRVALDTLMRHTVHDYELIVDAHQNNENAFASWNRMAKSANAEWLVPTCTDHFYTPGWDKPLWDARDPDTLVIGTLVESGYRPVAAQCIEHNFGFSPEKYDENAMNSFAASFPEMPKIEGWAMPWLVNKEKFWELGGFLGTTDLADLFFFQKWCAAGKAWKRVPSYCYHLQNWNSTGDQR